MKQAVTVALLASIQMYMLYLIDSFIIYTFLKQKLFIQSQCLKHSLCINSTITLWKENLAVT